MVQKILDENGSLIAIYLSSKFEKEGVEFFSEPSHSQQLGYMKYKKDHKILPHTHKRHQREIFFTQETLFLKSGKIRANLFNNQKKLIQSIEMTTGDVLLLISGGHGFDFLEESQLIEVKQGPYTSADMDKERF